MDLVISSVQLVQLVLLIIVLLCFTDVRLSSAMEDQTEDMRDELNLLIRRVNNLEEALTEKDIEIMEQREKIEELQEKMEDVQTENKELKEKMEELSEKIEDIRAENSELQEKIRAENKEGLEENIQDVRTENKELQEKIEDVQNPPFGYFCSYEDSFSTANSVITYDKLLYSSQFGLQGDSPGIDINTGKFVAGFSGTWRVDFSLVTAPDPYEYVYVYLYKNEERITETRFYSYHRDGSFHDVNTGGRSVLLHLELGDEVHLGTTLTQNIAWDILFCVSLEQFDV